MKLLSPNRQTAELLLAADRSAVCRPEAALLSDR